MNVSIPKKKKMHGNLDPTLNSTYILIEFLA